MKAKTKEQKIKDTEYASFRKITSGLIYESLRIGYYINDITAFVHDIIPYKFGNTNYEQEITFLYHFDTNKALPKHYRYFFRNKTQAIKYGLYQGKECEKLILKKKLDAGW
jgi:hypothetical protein